MSRTKIHTIYKTADGQRVPSVTTILGELAKPSLIHWAWNLGTKGIDYRTFRDDLASIGTLAHGMILAHLKNEKLETRDYTASQIDLAENCFLKYLEWEKQHQVEPLRVEEPLVSESLRFGGTPDFYGKIDGLITVMDFKTGKAIYDEYWYQLAGYGRLVSENMPGSLKIDNYRTLNIGRDETEQFTEKQKTDLSTELEIFIAALTIYQLKRGQKTA